MKKLIFILLALFCTMTLSPQLASAQSTELVSVKGKVLTPRGKAHSNATVVLTNTEGNRWTVVTNRLGVFAFRDVASGQTYVMGVSSKRYRFASRVVNVTGNISNLVFKAAD